MGKITTVERSADRQRPTPAWRCRRVPILAVHRSDGSGTTNIFTTYLSAVSTQWKEMVGANTAVSWPAGVGGKGNEGVAGLVHQTPGSIGYVELAYAKQNKLSMALVRNKAGKFVEPTPGIDHGGGRGGRRGAREGRAHADRERGGPGRLSHRRAHLPARLPGP